MSCNCRVFALHVMRSIPAAGERMPRGAKVSPFSPAADYDRDTSEEKSDTEEARRSQTRERSLRRKNVPVPVVVRGDRVGDHATPSWDVILATRTTSAGRKEKGDVQKGMDAVGGVGSTR